MDAAVSATGTVAEPAAGTAEGRPPRNASIQWLRAVAAAMVLLFHASHYLDAVRGDPRMLDVFGGEFGVLGVAIFFAISGALMADALERMSSAEFLVHRIARIYPTFLLASVVLPPFVVGRLALDGRALSLVPLGPNGSYRLEVEWTLIFELFYYLLLFLLAAGGWRRFAVPLAAIWVAGTGLAVVLLPSSITNVLLPTIVTIVLNPANAAFAGGLLIPCIARRGVRVPLFAVLAVAAAVLLMPLVERQALPTARLVAALAAVLVVGIAYARPADRLADTAFGRIASAFGNWSYGLYLCHPTVLVVVLRHAPVEAPAAAWAVAVGAALAVSVPLGMLDVRVYRGLRRRVSDASPRFRRRVAWGYVAGYAALGLAFAAKELVEPSAPWVSGPAG